MDETGQKGILAFVAPVDFSKEESRCKEFVSGFGVLDGAIKKSKYMEQLQEISNGHCEDVRIELEDVCQYFGNTELCRSIQKNTARYEQIFCRVVDELLPPPTEQVALGSMDVVQLLIAHRRARLEGSGYSEEKIKKTFPEKLMRRYTVRIAPLAVQPAVAVREIRAEHVGALVKLRCMATKATEVTPLMTVGTYTCARCGYETYQEITGQAFMPVPECRSEECQKSGRVTGTLELQTRGSRFMRFQEVRVQELQDQVPVGHIPRSMSVHVIESQTRKIRPGDCLVVSGIFLPRPYTGFKAMKAGLLTDTYLLATDIVHLKQAARLEDRREVDEQVQQLASEKSVFKRLAASIAPEIYGHLDIKEILLLLMVGGVSRELQDGVRQRGDINVCLMGDPGVAKSQLLKHVARTVPRGVYTTGKGSSGVGLTAAVTRDSVSGEVVLEGGALILADNGVCCIDEFDKMDERDRAAIHEVMEQQTVSISKAGVNAVLNARASVLAAANPASGRYNTKKSPKENINLPYALLSRFDIMFLMVDRPDFESDTLLAEHVAEVHRTLEAPAGSTRKVSTEVLQQYIVEARKHVPVVPEEVGSHISRMYVSMRKETDKKHGRYVTARALLSIVRLSQALARLRLGDVVQEEDVDEAWRLFECAQASVCGDEALGNKSVDPVSAIFAVVRDLARESNGRVLAMEGVQQEILSRGFSVAQLGSCLEQYEQCNVWKVSSDRQKLELLN